MMNAEEQKLEHIIRRMQTDKSVDAPADVVKYVKNLYRSRVAQPQTSAIRRFVAALKMELSPDRAAFGERSGSASATRQILFEAGDNAVDLRIAKSGKNFDIRGQILGPGFSGCDAILAGDEGSMKSTIDENSGFQFNQIKTGEYSLTIKSDQSEIFIEQLILQ